MGFDSVDMFFSLEGGGGTSFLSLLRLLLREKNKDGQKAGNCSTAIYGMRLIHFMHLAMGSEKRKGGKEGVIPCALRCCFWKRVFP
jgi:hypothetical protein